MHSRPARLLFTIADLIAWPCCAIGLLGMAVYPFVIGTYLARKGISVPTWMLTAEWLGLLLASIGMYLSLRRTPFALVPLALGAIAFAVARDWPFAIPVAAYAAVFVLLPHVLAMQAYKRHGGSAPQG